jgi:hypothetical protein
MGRFTLSIFINRPQREVFDFLGDLPISQNGIQILSLQSGHPAMRLKLVQFIEHQVKDPDLIRSSHEQAKPIDYRNY